MAKQLCEKLGANIMNENYIVINGKKSELTEEQLKALGVEVETKRKNPFEEVDRFEDYYFVEKNNEVYAYMKTDSSDGNQLYTSANYFNDKAFAEQVALHQLLYRKLLKFAYANGCEDVEWNPRHAHWYIYYDIAYDKFCISSNDTFKHQEVYFSTKSGAEQAIKEVVEPFMEEHPEFVW